MSENKKKRELIDFIDEIEQQKDGLTAPQICRAYKAALSDFVLCKTNRASIKEVSKLLAGSLNARRQQLQEEKPQNSFGMSDYYS